MIEAPKLQFEIPDSGFGIWNVPECPFRIEYAPSLIEEIRHQVAEGFQKLSRGGVEVGGMLLGTREDGVLRLTSIVAIACEHARGPGFLLSDADRQLLSNQLETQSGSGETCLGWFLSHTRSDVNLSESDLEIYHEYFAAPWQVALVVRPARGGSMRAGFFFRENNGNVQAEKSYQEFDFPDRLAGVIDHLGRGDRRTSPDRRRQREENGPSVVEEFPSQSTSLNSPMFKAGEPNASSLRKRLPWIAAWVAAFVAVAGFAVPFISGQKDAKAISLTLLEKQGILQVEWNRTPEVSQPGSIGNLMIVDGTETHNVTLGSKDLEAGRFAYQRKTGEIEVRLSLRLPDGTSIQEASRFLGRTPATDPSEMSAADARRAQLESEVTRLRSENVTQQDRIQQLERTLRVLQNRLGIK